MTSLLRCFARFSLFAFLAVLVACDVTTDSDDASNVNGESSLVLAGSVDKSTSAGRAAFATGDDFDDLEGPGVGFVLYEQSRSSVTWLVLTSEGSNTLPASGTYPVVDPLTTTPGPGTFGALYVTSDDDGSVVVVPTSGTLTIERSEPNRIDGTIAFDGVAYTVDDVSASALAGAASGSALGKTTGSPVTMTGAFQSRRADRDRIEDLLDDLGINEFDGLPLPLPQLGRSDFLIRGSAVASYAGSALFGSAALADQPGDGFALVLFTGTPSGDDGAALLLFRGSGAVPEPGAYAIADPFDDATLDPDAFAAILIDTDRDLFVAGVTGTVTITSSSPTAVSGQVAFGAVDFTGQNPDAQYTVTGTYDAISGDVEDILPDDLVPDPAP